MITVIGKDSKNEHRFSCVLPRDLTFEIIQMFELGEDHEAIELMERLDHIQRDVVDAMGWVDFDVIDLIDKEQRFAIKHNDIEFGVGADTMQAHLALQNEEF